MQLSPLLGSYEFLVLMKLVHFRLNLNCYFLFFSSTFKTTETVFLYIFSHAIRGQWMPPRGGANSSSPIPGYGAAYNG